MGLSPEAAAGGARRLKAPVWLRRSRKAPAVGESLAGAAQVAAPVGCWASRPAGGDVLSGCIPMPVPLGLRCSWQPPVRHLWKTSKWPKALAQAARGPGTSFGSATVTCPAVASQVLALPSALSNTKGLAVTRESRMRLRTRPWEGGAVLERAGPVGHPYRDVTARHVRLVAPGKGLGLRDTCALASS